MPDRTFTIARGDLLPPITIAATYSDGTIVDLSTVTSPRFMMRLASAADGATPKVDAVATVVSGPAGTIRYSWAGTDTNTAGTYTAEFEVTVGGKKLTFPSRKRDKIMVVVTEDLG